MASTIRVGDLFVAPPTPVREVEEALAFASPRLFLESPFSPDVARSGDSRHQSFGTIEP